MLIFQFYVKYHREECNLLYFKQYLPRIFLLIHNKLHIIVKICLKVINLILFPRKISFIWFSHKRWFEYENWIMELNDWAEPDLNQVKHTWLLIYVYSNTYMHNSSLHEKLSKSKTAGLVQSVTEKCAHILSISSQTYFLYR